MDIGSAKDYAQWNERDFASLDWVIFSSREEEFNVVRFQKMALEEMEQIYEKGKIPLIVGINRFLYPIGSL